MKRRLIILLIIVLAFSATFSSINVHAFIVDQFTVEYSDLIPTPIYLLSQTLYSFSLEMYVNSSTLEPISVYPGGNSSRISVFHGVFDEMAPPMFGFNKLELYLFSDAVAVMVMANDTWILGIDLSVNVSTTIVLGSNITVLFDYQENVTIYNEDAEIYTNSVVDASNYPDGFDLFQGILNEDGGTINVVIDDLRLVNETFTTDAFADTFTHYPDGVNYLTVFIDNAVDINCYIDGLNYSLALVPHVAGDFTPENRTYNCFNTNQTSYLTSSILLLPYPMMNDTEGNLVPVVGSYRLFLARQLNGYWINCGYINLTLINLQSEATQNYSATMAIVAVIIVAAVTGVLFFAFSQRKHPSKKPGG